MGCDPTLDATDGACPCWWRGHDHVEAAFKRRVRELENLLLAERSAHAATRGVAEAAVRKATRAEVALEHLSMSSARYPNDFLTTVFASWAAGELRKRAEQAEVGAADAAEEFWSKAFWLEAAKYFESLVRDRAAT